MSGNELVQQSSGRAAGIVCLAWKPVTGHGSLRGFVDLQIPGWRFRLLGCAVHAQGEKAWVQLPGKPLIDSGGVALRDAERGGRIKYIATCAFDDAATLKRFSEAAVAAVLECAPDALGNQR